ncbi:Putative phosphatidylglycerophosphate synthase [Fulvivirga imtechensis AK7]|uniref:Putative phosphatidylglycerophosphate synthase n=1 Tax=Fulvivirga imtechensis AK7 TaxID=1237149 RepID=L8JRG6_9BACT|nr:CDP-alcohol phosphatidyltransferase family protein [Fulvivirga imtechensis]ELR71460.1 Putative phosphatidylglycerophosphate synthase [Fulvivirga imtechensis AK7]
MKKLNIADWFSVYRIAALPVIIVAILLDKRTMTGWLLIISFLTDAIDGYLARKKKITSRRGARLDSAGDALTFLVGIFGVYIFGLEKIFQHFYVISVALSLYLFQLILGFIRYGKSSSLHTYSAKTAAVLQATFLVIFYLHEWVPWLFWIAIIISIIETIEEIIIIFILPKWETDVKGLYWVLKRR